MHDTTFHRLCDFVSLIYNGLVLLDDELSNCKNVVTEMFLF